MGIEEDLGNQLFLAIDHLEAQEDLRKLMIADFPYLKDFARKKVHNELVKKANPRFKESEGKALTLEELGRVIQNG